MHKLHRRSIPGDPTTKEVESGDDEPTAGEICHPRPPGDILSMSPPSPPLHHQRRKAKNDATESDADDERHPRPSSDVPSTSPSSSLHQQHPRRRQINEAATELCPTIASPSATPFVTYSDFTSLTPCHRLPNSILCSRADCRELPFGLALRPLEFLQYAIKTVTRHTRLRFMATNYSDTLWNDFAFRRPMPVADRHLDERSCKKITILR